MKIKLSHLQLHSLAEDFAKEIHAEVVHMHLRRSWGCWPVDDERECIYTREKSRAFQEVQAAIRSVKDKHDRWTLIGLIRFHFNAICKEHGTHRKWQDYVVSVQQAVMEHNRRAARAA